MGADIHFAYSPKGSTLAVAVKLRIVLLRLDQGAGINAVGAKYGTALGRAAQGGSVEVASLPLDRGVDINIVGGVYGTALQDTQILPSY